MKVGFLGSGHMSQAMISGLISGGFLHADLGLFSPNNGQKVAQQFNIRQYQTAAELVTSSDVIFLGFLPKHLVQYHDLLGQNFSSPKTIVSMLGETSLEELTSLNHSVSWLRILPNLPVRINTGFIAYASNEEGHQRALLALLATLGEIQKVDETLFPTYSAILGSGPAFVAALMEGLAKAGVLHGIDKANLAPAISQLLIGTAKMTQSTTFNQLIDQVASPGGSTIKGINHLEQSAFQGIIMETITKTMGK